MINLEKKILVSYNTRLQTADIVHFQFKLYI
jgi:hypothetical protein